MIVPLASYPTSRDYRQLWELAHSAAIVCIVDGDYHTSDMCRDIAKASRSSKWSPDLVMVGSYIWAESVEEFIAQCAHRNLEWLIPASPVLSHKP